MCVRRALAAVVVGLALVAAMPLPARAAREASAPYVLGTDPIVAGTVAVMGAGPFELACEAGASSASVGQVCFSLEPGESHARIRIVDATGVQVSGGVTFYDEAGEGVYPWSTSFCSRAEIELPKAAVYAVVHVHGSTLGCGIGGGVGTTGTVVAFFS